MAKQATKELSLSDLTLMILALSLLMHTWKVDRRNYQIGSRNLKKSSTTDEWEREIADMTINLMM